MSEGTVSTGAGESTPVQAPAQAPAQAPVQEAPAAVVTPAGADPVIADNEAPLLGRSGETSPEGPTEQPSVRSIIAGKILENKSASLAVNLLDKVLPAGVDVQRALGKAFESGNLQDVDENYLHEVLGGDVDVVFDAIEHLFHTASEQDRAYQEEVYSSIPGGEATLEQASKAFAENAEPHQIAAMKHLLNTGDPELGKFAAMYVYQTALANGAVVAEGTTSFGQPAGLQPLSRKEYAAEIIKGGHTDAEYQILRQRLALGMQQRSQ